jgi:cephalosporin hydroxylase
MAWAENEIRDTEEIRAYGATFATDKIEDKRYFQTYLKIAADLGPRASVCEIGVWQGESLRMWQGLFPLGKVAGIDYQTQDRVWPPGTVQVISTQDNPALPGLLEQAGVLPLGLVVDDASHREPQTSRCFEMLWPLIAPGGYYVIEDWFMNELPSSVPGLTRLLAGPDDRDTECDYVHFRWGMAIAHKRARAAA